MKTDQTYWTQVQHLVEDFMNATYDKCEGWKCGAMASVALKRFHDYVEETMKIDRSTISYHTFYNALRNLGYDIPVVKGGFDANKTRIKGIIRKDA